MLVDTIWQSNWFLVLRSLYFESILSLYLTDNLLYLISDTTFIIMYNWGCVMADNYSQIFLLYFNIFRVISESSGLSGICRRIYFGYASFTEEGSDEFFTGDLIKLLINRQNARTTAGRCSR